MQRSLLSILCTCAALFVVPSMALAGKTPAVDWVYETGDAVHGSPALAGDLVLIGSTDGNLYALNREDGAVSWTFESGGEIRSTPAVSGDTAFVTSQDGYLYAVATSDGDLNWKQFLGEEKPLDIWDYFQASPVVHEGVVIAGSAAGVVVALDAASGQEKWRFETKGAIRATPAVYEGSIYVGTLGGHLYRIDAETGEPEWDFKTVGDQWFPKGEIQAAPLVHGGRVVFGSRDFNLYALDAEKGHGLWNFKERGSWVIATPVAQDEALFVGTSDSYHFYKIGAARGKILWTFDTPLNVFGSACFVGDDVVFGTLDGRIYALDSESGAEQWSFATEASEANYGEVFNEEGSLRKDLYERIDNNVVKLYELIHSLGSIVSTPVCTEEQIIFGSMDGKVYALELR